MNITQDELNDFFQGTVRFDRDVRVRKKEFVDKECKKIVNQEEKITIKKVKNKFKKN